MPKKSTGCKKRKKRKEKAEKVEALQPADATCSGPPCVVGAEALPISDDRELSETEENPTGHFVSDSDNHNNAESKSKIF